MVTVNGSAASPEPSRISSGSSTASVSGRLTRAPPEDRTTGRRAGVVATAPRPPARLPPSPPPPPPPPPARPPHRDGGWVPPSPQSRREHGDQPARERP